MSSTGELCGFPFHANWQTKYAVCLQASHSHWGRYLRGRLSATRYVQPFCRDGLHSAIERADTSFVMQVVPDTIWTFEQEQVRPLSRLKTGPR